MTKLNRRQLRAIIQEASSEHYTGGQADYEEKQNLMRRMAEEEYDSDAMYYEKLRDEQQEAMYASALDALVSIIGSGISSEALIGQIRKNRSVNVYSFESVMKMIDSLEQKSLITGFLGS